MSTNKKWFYLRMKEDFFNQPEIKLLMAEKRNQGYELVIIYQKMMLESLKNDGALQLSEFRPHTAETLSIIFDHALKKIETALSRFKDLGLIRINKDGVISMLDIIDSRTTTYSTDSSEAVRKRLSRKELKVIKNHSGKQSSKQHKTRGSDGGGVDKRPPYKETELKKEIYKEPAERYAPFREVLTG